MKYDFELRRSPVSAVKSGQAEAVVACTAKSRWASAFGGPDVDIGPRVGPGFDGTEADGNAAVTERLQADEVCAADGIRYRSCSWPKTAALLFAEYIGLAIMCFPAAYAQLGWVGGLVSTLFVAASYQYTSLIIWEFCLRHPEVRDICDIGRLVFGNTDWAYWVTAIMFVGNNSGLHVVVGGEYLNTVLAHWSAPVCKTVLFCLITAILCWVTSLPRTFSMLSHLATLSALFTFVSVSLAAAFIATQEHPANYVPATDGDIVDGSLPVGEPVFSAWPAPGYSFVSIMVAFLNICYTFIGQITVPSFVAEMKDPRDFPKALWLCTSAELVVFCTIGTVIYKYTGMQYVTSPAFGGLEHVSKVLSFSFMVPTTVILGAMYASITARFVFFRVFEDTVHLRRHTVVGWSAWSGILLVTWTAGFLVSQIIPFFSSLLALVAAIFNAFFGFIYWGAAWLRMRGADHRAGRRVRSKEWDRVLVAVNVSMIVVGVGVFLGAGTVASINHILHQFAVGNVKGVFTCSSNAV
ncbi:N amino acid transport system protein [Purpureocillium lavendulum]|uniref:N amino acid transport system protein n=1 Tax=Purpureocillium lavendulum TaxID=1247861 RepID=A0AB34FGR0_9HYPO|nr:N amino acid transport system protein [Purpureocillium lavendulum]